MALAVALAVIVPTRRGPACCGAARRGNECGGAGCGAAPLLAVPWPLWRFRRGASVVALSIAPLPVAPTAVALLAVATLAAALPAVATPGRRDAGRRAAGHRAAPARSYNDRDASAPVLRRRGRIADECRPPLALSPWTMRSGAVGSLLWGEEGSRAASVAIASVAVAAVLPPLLAACCRRRGRSQGD